MVDVSLFRPRVQDGFEWILPDSDDSYEVLLSSGGRSLAGLSISCHLLRRDRGDRKVRLPADLPWLGEHVLVLNSRALGVLEHLLAESGELIPLEWADGEYWLFNCTTVADPLDWEASDVARLDSGQVLDIKRPEFRMDGLPRGPFRVAGFTREACSSLSR